MLDVKIINSKQTMVTRFCVFLAKQTYDIYL